MIFWTWRSYFICWQIFENKVWCPVSKKIRRFFHVLLFLAYPIDRLDWALFSVVILFHDWFPLLEKLRFGPFFLPRNSPAVFIISRGRGGAGNPHLPIVWGGAGSPPPQGGLNQGVRPSYYNFQISPRTHCTISTDCFAESPVTVSFDHTLCTFWSINMRRFTHQMTNH